MIKAFIDWLLRLLGIRDDKVAPEIVVADQPLNGWIQDEHDSRDHVFVGRNETASHVVEK